jgi:hypothetical protein
MVTGALTVLADADHKIEEPSMTLDGTSGCPGTKIGPHGGPAVTPTLLPAVLGAVPTLMSGDHRGCFG